MNDVSVLFPLPSEIETKGYLTADTAGLGGPLLPSDVFARIPDFGGPGSDFVRARLRGVAVRFDGCFRKSKADPCEAQVRIVMQPVADGTEVGGAPGTEFLDSATHLFYRVPETEFPKLVNQLRNLRALEPETEVAAPLQVHPSLAAQGVGGAYGKALLDVVRAYAGAENLIRMTVFLRTRALADEWDFGGVVRSDREWKPLPIPGGVGDKQRVNRGPDATPEYAYTVLPLASTPEDVTVAISSYDMAEATPAAREATFAALLRIENPKVHSADSVQCVACHISTVVGTLAADRYGFSFANFKDAYVSPSRRNLTLTHAPVGAQVLRAFGWAAKSPVISRRVVNESADVLDDLDARFPKALR